MRSVILAAAAVVLVAPAAAAQEPRFDVASVRPHRAADDLMFALQFHDGGRLTATGTLRMLIRTAYRLQEFQVAGPRGWIDDELYDVDARAGGDATPTRCARCSAHCCGSASPWCSAPSAGTHRCTP